METKQKENPHKPMLNGILAVILIVLLIFITAKSTILGLVSILIFASFIMTYIINDDPENYVIIYKDDLDYK